MSDTPRDEWPMRQVPWAVMVPLLALAPFVGLTVLAFPHDDDVWFGADFLQIRSLTGFLRTYYQSVNGRLFADTVMVLPYMAHHRLGLPLLPLYRIVCAGVLLATVALAVWIAVELMPSASQRLRVFLGAALACALVSGIPAPNEIYYWITGIGNYTLAAMAALACMVWLERQTPRPLSPLAVALLAGVGFVTAMSTEMSGPIMFIIVAAAFAERWLTPGAPRQTLAHAICLSAILVGTLIVAMSPGNAMRMNAYGQAHNLGWNAAIAIPFAAVRLMNFLVQCLITPVLLAWILILAVSSYENRHLTDTEPPRLIWLPLATALLAAYVSFWIGQFGSGHYQPPRARSHFYFVLVGGLSLTVLRATRLYGDRVRAWFTRRWPALTARHVALVALALLAFTPHTLAAMKTAVWDSRPLAAAIDDRFARLAGGEQPASRDLVLPRLPARGWPVVSDDLSPDPTHWSNRALARYYGFHSVQVVPPP